MTSDPFVQFKAAQREGWSLFAPLATFTTPAAAALVEFAGPTAGMEVLDVACGTGVVAVTAAQRGAKVSGLDLSPVLLQDARKNAEVIGAQIDFREGDAEALPYSDGRFDMVLSQFGHMFAPRPQIALAEMLRVLKPGGRIAFSTWPPELMIGSVFRLVSQYLAPPPGAAPPPAWGEPQVVRERLGEAVREIEFDRAEIYIPALSPRHYRQHMELTAAPVIKIVETLAAEPARLEAFRTQMEALAARFFEHNRVRQSYLMTRALKR
ncbi:MAG TPA: class I SAM-dependent methyltransferase [Solimonas sp.]|nr:class I SAM-dependent methyltransferase [Solimonas sp.]